MADSNITSPPTLSFTCHTSSYPAIDPSKNKDGYLSMSGRSVLVTGASKSIGAAIAESFAQAGAANLIILSRSETTLNSVAGKLREKYENTKIYVRTLDLATATFEDCQQLVKSITNESGVECIDTLVLNAAHIHDKSGIAEPDFLSGDFWKCFETNVRGNLNLVRSFLLAPSCPQDATIVNVTSVLAYVPGARWLVSGYGGSKSAFSKVLEYLHVERPTLRIFHLHPGLVKSEMSSKAGIPQHLDDCYYDDVDLPANFCVWLASSRADFLNGRTVESRWDVEDMEQAKDKILADPRVFRVGLQGRGFVPNS